MSSELYFVVLFVYSLNYKWVTIWAFLYVPTKTDLVLSILRQIGVFLYIGNLLFILYNKLYTGNLLYFDLQKKLTLRIGVNFS